MKIFWHFFPFFIIKNWFRTKKYSCKFSQKLIVKKIKKRFTFEAGMIIWMEEKNHTYLHLLNYKFLWKFTWILFCSKSIFYHKKIMYDQITIAFLHFLFIVFMIKNWFRTKKYSCKFSQNLIVKKIQMGSNI